MTDGMMDFERIRGAILAFHLCLTAMAIAFLLEVLREGSPITPELYGARVYMVDAWIWAAIQFTACCLAAIGAFLGGKLGALLVATGAWAAGFMFLMFAVMAADAEQGSLVMYGSAFYTAPLSVGTGLSAFNFLWRRHG